MSNLERVNHYLQKMETIVNDERPIEPPDVFHVGIDLGTADIVLTVTDDEGAPLAAFMEWAEVVRDGVVLDYWGAVQIVKRLLQKAEVRIGQTINQAITSYPPGTDPIISKNVIEAVQLQVETLIDEPSSVARLLNLENGLVVDIGGGTTGMALIEGGQIRSVSDEPTGGRHVSLTIAGNQRIPFDRAEQLKTGSDAQSYKPIVQPVFQKMADIIRNHINGAEVHSIYLAGGTCCFPGIDAIFKQELPEYEIILPANPLFLTPLAIASYRNEYVEEI